MPKLINSIKKLVKSESFCNRHKQNPQDFTRTRALPFHQLIYFFLNMPRAAYETELCNFNRTLQHLDVAEPLATKGALTKARRKLNHCAFIEMNNHLAEYYQRDFNPLRWNGFLLLAIDGTLTNIPNVPEIINHFGQWKPRLGNPCPKARVSQLYDVMNHMTIAGLITPKDFGERELAAAHCPNLQEDHLLLLDRGYESFWLFKTILSYDASFCARVSANRLNIVKQFVSSGDTERIIKLQCSYTSALKCADLELDKSAIKLRLIRVDLPSGETEVLITSLTDRHVYPIDQFAELYHERWPIEEDYKVIKCRIQMENFTGKTVHSVYQDFYARLFTKNLTSVIIRSVSGRIRSLTEGRLHLYKANFTNALAMMRTHIVVLFNRQGLTLLSCIDNLQTLIARVLCEVRPGRSVPRIFRKKSRAKFSPAYKPIS